MTFWAYNKCKDFCDWRNVMRFAFFFLLFVSSLSNAMVYCHANSQSEIFLKGSQASQTGDKGETTKFPLTNLSSKYFPYSVDNYYNSPIGYESHAASTSLPQGSEGGWRRINDFLEVQLSYQGKNVPYGWTYTGNKVKCNSWPRGSLQNFGWIIDKTNVILRLTKTLVGGNIVIPRTVLYRQHWGVADSPNAVNDMVDESKYLYQLVLTDAVLNFPAVCKMKTMNLDVDFGSVGLNEVNMKEVIKSIDFECDRDAQLSLQVNSTRLPYGNNSDNKKVSFGTSLKNLNVDAEFEGMVNKGNGMLVPPVSVKKGSVVSIPVKFSLNQKGDISTGVFNADGYIVLYQD
ncbi:hypothetical protein LAX15_21895 [Escherichia coli]|nr:hypothetical protein [Escherichia coli]MDD8883369.1 hypothetical protein [Escherichia coli]